MISIKEMKEKINMQNKNFKLNEFVLNAIEKSVQKDVKLSVVEEMFEGEILKDYIKATLGNGAALYVKIKRYHDDMFYSPNEYKEAIESAILDYEKMCEEKDEIKIVNYVTNVVYHRFNSEVLSMAIKNQKVSLNRLIIQNVEKRYKKTNGNFEKTYDMCINKAVFKDMVDPGIIRKIISKITSIIDSKKR